jgi:hypothetical protein
MMKVRILDRCEFCDGEAYIFVCEDVDARGETFDRYRPCEMFNANILRVIFVEKDKTLNMTFTISLNSKPSQNRTYVLEYYSQWMLYPWE